MTARDRHVTAVDLHDVVTGPSVPAEPQRGNGARRHDEEVLEAPCVRHVLVPEQHEVDARALQALDRVAGVVDDVPLAPVPGTGSRWWCSTKIRRNDGSRENCSSIHG
jgi:hypothetical protein